MVNPLPGGGWVSFERPPRRATTTVPIPMPMPNLKSKPRAPEEINNESLFTQA